MLLSLPPLFLALAGCDLTEEKNRCFQASDCLSGFVCESGVCIAEGFVTPADKTEQSLLPDGVYALSGIDTSLPTTDLAPLADRIGERAFVALGNAIPASGGFIQAQLRVTRY